MQYKEFREKHGLPAPYQFAKLIAQEILNRLAADARDPLVMRLIANVKHPCIIKVNRRTLEDLINEMKSEKLGMPDAPYGALVIPYVAMYLRALGCEELFRLVKGRGHSHTYYLRLPQSICEEVMKRLGIV
jgi:hypothetical protein